MKLPKIAVKRPHLTLMVFLAIILTGIVSYSRLPVDIVPEIEIPQITIITIYPGASSENVEQEVTKILEEFLGTISNIKHINSESKDNVSIIRLVMDYGTNIDEIANDARGAIEFAKDDLPSGAYTPRVMKISSDMIPIIMLSVTTDRHFYNLETLIEDKITNKIKRISGVANIMTVGLPEREIQINISPERLEKYSLSINHIKTLLDAENITIPGGDITIGSTKWTVNIPGEVRSIEELKNIPVGNYLNHVIYLKDISDIKDTISEKTMIMIANNSPAVGLMISKQSGSNSVEVSTSVIEEIEKIREILPEGIEITVVQNYADLVNMTINNLKNAVIVAIIAVTLVVFFFLRRFRPSLIILTTIPVTLLITFSAIFLRGYTINIISLMSMAIAVGMVVDNGIVVLENIDKYRFKGVRIEESSIYGASEMGQAITTSTLTTIVVFFPLIFLGGFIGIMFSQLAFVIIVTISASLFVALTLTPMLTSELFKRKETTFLKQSKFYKYSEKLFEKIDNIYSKLLSFSIRHKFIVLIISLAVFLLSLLLIPVIGTDFIPDFDTGEVMIQFQTPPGTDLQSTYNVTEKIENILNDSISEMTNFISITGESEGGLLSVGGFEEGTNYSTIMARILPVSERTRSSMEIASMLREEISKIPNISKLTVSATSSMMKTITGAKSDIEIFISGPDLAELNTIAFTLKQKIEEIKGIVDIRSSVDNGKPELRIEIDREKATRLGLNTLLIASQVRQAIYGQGVNSFTQEGRDYDIIIKYDSQHRQDKEDIENILLTTLLGTQVKLKEVARIVELISPSLIIRRDQERTVVIRSSISGRPLGDIMEEIQQILSDEQIPSDVNITIGGASEEQKDTFSDLYLLFILSFFLIYMVMCGQFGSFRDPFVIMFSIPFTITGVVLSFIITGNTLNVITSLGIIMLLGIVVNNGIVLVDYMNLLRKRGLSLTEAIVSGGRSRLRPVLMTSLTTILGLMPLAISRSQGHEFWSAFASTAMGGLFLSTFVTLIIVPIMYFIFHIKDKQIAGE